MTIALAILTVTLALRILILGAVVSSHSSLIVITRLELTFALVICVVGIFISRERFRWFASHRSIRAILAFFVTEKVKNRDTHTFPMIGE